MLRASLGDPIYNRCKTHERGARKKTSPKIWWIQKVVVPLHSQPQRKGGRKCPAHDWGLVTMVADRNACWVYVMTRLPGWFRDSMKHLLVWVFIDWQKTIGEKKLLQIFGGFKNLSYLCTHNPQEKADRSSQVKRRWSGALKRATLTGIIEAIFDIFHN